MYIVTGNKSIGTAHFRTRSTPHNLQSYLSALQLRFVVQYAHRHCSYKLLINLTQLPQLRFIWNLWCNTSIGTAHMINIPTSHNQHSCSSSEIWNLWCNTSIGTAHIINIPTPHNHHSCASTEIWNLWCNTSIGTAHVTNISTPHNHLNCFLAAIFGAELASLKLQFHHSAHITYCLWLCLWLAATSQQPTSQSTCWLLVTHS